MTTKRRTSPGEATALYSRLAGRIQAARALLGRPLTLTEKILFSHLAETPSDVSQIQRGVSHVGLYPDRIAMQDATAQMALLQFMLAGMDRVMVPTTVHCDHLIQAVTGATQDLAVARTSNSEVYDFLLQSSTRYGVGFWEPGSGIIHQVVLENYAFPGALMIGTDSHTPNAGGMGMLAIGVGGADAVFTMAGEPWNVKWPKLIGVRLTGSLNGWAAPKDVILKLAGILTVKGGTGAVIEYFGPGASGISATGKATITNMGAELGATTSVFPCDDHTLAYLRLTGRGEIANLAEQNAEYLRADREVEADPGRFFDQVIEIDLDTLEPYIVGPHTPDLARPLSEFAREVAEEGYPDELKYALIGSCTNSSYEDMSRAAAVAREAMGRGLRANIGLLVTPGSEQVHRTISRDGQLASLLSIGGTVLANACGPCIGQWKRSDIAPGETNSIITSFNRNFPRRNDGNASTLAFIASPEIVTAFALAGRLSFNPLTDTLTAPDGSLVKLSAPPQVGLPERGFASVDTGFVAPDPEGAPAVSIDQASERLELLSPFQAWSGHDFENLPVLLKAKGKCTTDHISPAGPWLRFRGHLDRISDNMFAGANNAFVDKPGSGLDVLGGDSLNLARLARKYRSAGMSWVVVGDENYGEGSSREHAAMSPRHLGCLVVIARSFARIHETNLKQQGVLALTFSDPADYDRIEADSRISVVGLDRLEPGSPVRVLVKNSAGSTEISCRHSMTMEQIEWFRAGSALNHIKLRGSKTVSKETPKFAAGLEGVIACATRLSEVDGNAGQLIFSGFMAPELAASKSVEAVWFLFHNGRLPTGDELAEFTASVEAHGVLSAAEVKLVRQFRNGEPLSDFRSAVSAVAAARGYKPWLNRDLAEVEEEILSLCSLAPAIIEVLRTGRKPLLKRGNSGYAERYLWGLLRQKPSTSAVKALSTYLVLTMDHGMNASTFASRVTASTGADVGAAITAGIATLSGPLHGGAPGPVLDMLDAIGSPDQAGSWVTDQLTGKRRIMGFGHRVYRTDDPRALALREVARCQKGPRIGLATVVEQEVLSALAAHQQAKAAAIGQPTRPLRTNVEFWTAVVLEHVGIPRELFSSTFAVSRIIGWGEHVREQIGNNKLFRPLSAYTGPDPR